MINCQYVDPRDAAVNRRRETAPEPLKAVPLPAPLLAAAPLNPNMETTRYNTAAGGEYTIDTTGRLTRRSQLEEEQRTGRTRSPVSQNPLLIQSAIAIAANDSSNIDMDVDGAGGVSKVGVMAYVKTHPRLVINYADI